MVQAVKLAPDEVINSRCYFYFVFLTILTKSNTTLIMKPVLFYLSFNQGRCRKPRVKDKIFCTQTNIQNSAALGKFAKLQGQLLCSLIQFKRQIK